MVLIVQRFLFADHIMMGSSLCARVIYTNYVANICCAMMRISLTVRRRVAVYHVNHRVFLAQAVSAIVALNAHR